MDVRIGVIQTPKEIDVELGDDADPATIVADVEAALSDFFEARPLTFAAREVQPNLWAMAMDTEESLQESLRRQLKLPRIARIGPLARSFDFVATAAPGVREILTVGKLAWETRERH